MTGGAEIQTLILAQGLVKRGYNTVYLAANADTENKSRINDLDVIKIPGAGKVGAVRHKQYLENAILESRPDLCYVRSFSQFMWAIPFCKKNGIPVVSMCCSGMEISPFLAVASLREFVAYITTREFGRHFLNFRAIQLSDVHVCVTKCLQEGIKYWYPNKSIQVVYNGHHIPPSTSVHSDYSKSVIWVNNIKRIKRPEIFIKLAACLPDIEFKMIGRIEDKGRYNNYVRALIQKGPENLKYLGAQPFDKVNAEISTSDILVYTSTEMEGFGNSLIQAWMRGVPTLSLNYDPDRIIERERIGFCASDFSDLRIAARTLIDSPATLSEMGQRARMYAETAHDCHLMVSRYDVLFRELVARRNIGPRQDFEMENKGMPAARGDPYRRHNLGWARIKSFIRPMLFKYPELDAALVRIWRAGRFFLFTCKWRMDALLGIWRGTHVGTRNVDKTYWISPDRIVFSSLQEFNLRTFKGRILDGDWDRLEKRFDSLDLYVAIKQVCVEGKKWAETVFYQRVLDDLKRGCFLLNYENENDLKEHCKKIESLYHSIKQHGYISQKNLFLAGQIDDPLVAEEEIAVSIGRYGDLLFSDGAHRLSIAKILRIPLIPVKVTVRHKNWIKSRKERLRHGQQSKVAGDGELCQSSARPDLSTLPVQQEDRIIE